MTKWTDVLFPQYNCCHVCERFLPLHHLICSNCVERLNEERLKPHVAQTDLSPLSACLSSFHYAGVPLELVHSLKYNSDCILATLFGEALAYTFAVNEALLLPIDGVIPVPLHSSRLEKRGYNQAELLAQSLCQHTQLCLENEILSRVKDTNTQVHRTADMRKKAMKGAFAVNDKEAVRGRRFLLVDDVLTTGATALACADALLRAQAASVSLLTVCKVSKHNPNL